MIDVVEDHDIEQWHMPKQWLRQIGNGQIDSLKLLSVSGDSMVPRLLHGDTVMIDTSQRMFSDNNAYSAYDRSIDEVCIIGRVVWFARTI